MNPLDVIVISGLFTVGGSTLAWFLARRDKGDERKYSSSAPGAPTVQEIWIRQDRMERAFKSSLVLLGEVAEQWDGEHPPVLSRRHVAILAEGGYLPPEWEPLVDERDSQVNTD